MSDDPTKQTTAAPFFHIAAPPCEHDFNSWRDFEDGRGGELVCGKCGMGAMEHTFRNPANDD